MGKYIQQIRVSFDHFPRNDQNELKENTKSTLIKLDVPLNLFYGYYLGKVETRGISMITIYLTNNKQMNNIIRDGDSNLILYCFFCEDFFLNLSSKNEMKRYYVDTVHQSLCFLCSHYSWNESNFENVRNLIIDNDYIFKFTIGKLKKNLNRKTGAYVYAESDPIQQRLNFYVCFKSDDSITMIPFAGAGESYGIIEYIANKTIWGDNDTFKIIMQNKSDYWKIDTSGRVDFYYEKAERGSAHSQYNLGLMYLNGQVVIQDIEKAVYWLKKSSDNGFLKSKIELQKLGR